MSFFRGKDFRDDQKSNLEIDLFLDFQHAKMQGRIDEVPHTPPYTAILLSKGDAPFITEPDMRWLAGKRFWRPVYVDGPVHIHDRIAKRDGEINRLLEKLGYIPLRYPFKTNTVGRRREIYDEIVEALELSLEDD